MDGDARAICYYTGLVLPSNTSCPMSTTRMSALELRASTSLAGIYSLRMFGMFLIPPVLPCMPRCWTVATTTCWLALRSVPTA